MKQLTIIKVSALFLFIALTLSFCKKEVAQQKRAFKASFDTWYRVSPTVPQPLVLNGQNYLGILHFPGGGTGNATHLGNGKIYFNQLAYIQPPGDALLGSMAAPLTAIPTYPVAGDFNELLSVLSTLNIPEKVGNDIVNQVIYNKKGDAIFSTAIAGSGSTTPVSPTRINFSGKGVLTGGRGKFANAVGEFDYSGFFNPTDQSDAGYDVDGWINY